MKAALVAAVVGLGVGEQHARALARLPQCELRWLFDLDGAKATRLAAAVGAQAAPSYEAILADDAVGLVSIASYDDAHFDQVVAALEAGKHVFVEKPLCRTMAELRRIKKLVGETGSQLASNLVLRSAPLYRWLRDAVRNGRLGEIYAFDGDYLYGRFHKITDGWRRDVLDYSVMEGGGIHLVDLMLWVTGQRPARVDASGNRIASAGTAFRYNDFATATFSFPSTMIGRVSANFGCVQPHQHVVRVFGTEATFLYDDAGARLHTSRDPAVGPLRLTEEPLPASKGDLIPEFVADIIRGNDRGAVVQHEFDVISASAAVDQAIATAHTVDVEYV